MEDFGCPEVYFSPGCDLELKCYLYACFLYFTQPLHKQLLLM